MASGGGTTKAIICQEVFDDGYQPSSEGKFFDEIMHENEYMYQSKWMVFFMSI